MRLPRPLLGAAALLVAVPLLPVGAAPYQRPGPTQRVSVATDGTEAEVDVPFSAPDLSADGRLVTFSTPAPLLPDDTNSATDVYLRDLVTGALERISVASDGTEGDLGAGGSSLSADGSLVAFQSASTNLVPGDTNGKTDVFIHDRETGETRIVAPGGNGISTLSAMAGNGSAVAFASDATNLVPGDTNGVRDIFVARLDDGTITRISVGDDEAQAVGAAEDAPAISADGTLIAFNSVAANLIAGDTNARSDTFVRDIARGTTERISVSSEEVATKENVFSSPSMSDDGRFVTFDTWSWNLVPNDTNGDVGPVFITFALGFDVYVRDRATGTTQEVTLTSAGVESDRDAGYPVISANGRYVAFTTPSLLAPGDTGGFSDIYLHDLATGATERVSVGADGSPGDAGSFLTALSADASAVAFQSGATNLVADDGNDRNDVFVRHRGPEAGVTDLAASVEDGLIMARGRAGLTGSVITSAGDPSGDAGDTGTALGADLIGASLSHRPEQDDLFLRLSLANIPEVRDPRAQIGAAAALGVVYGLELTAPSGTFQLRATQLAPAPSPRVRDESGTRLTPSSAETWRFELLRCETICTLVQTLSGGGGTAGDDVRLSVPLEVLPLPPGGALTGMRAFTATAGSLVPLDSADVPGTAMGAATVHVDLLRDGTVVRGPMVVVPAAGAFEAALPGGLPAGDYTLRATACFGARCGTRSVPISLP